MLLADGNNCRDDKLRDCSAASPTSPTPDSRTRKRGAALQHESVGCLSTCATQYAHVQRYAVPRQIQCGLVQVVFSATRREYRRCAGRVGECCCNTAQIKATTRIAFYPVFAYFHRTPRFHSQPCRPHRIQPTRVGVFGGTPRYRIGEEVRFDSSTWEDAFIRSFFRVAHSRHMCRGNTQWAQTWLRQDVHV